MHKSISGGDVCRRESNQKKCTEKVSLSAVLHYSGWGLGRSHVEVLTKTRFQYTFLVTFTSTDITARDGLVHGKVPNTRAQGATEGFVEKRRVSCQASL